MDIGHRIGAYRNTVSLNEIQRKDACQESGLLGYTIRHLLHSAGTRRFYFCFFEGLHVLRVWTTQLLSYDVRRQLIGLLGLGPALKRANCEKTHG